MEIKKKKDYWQNLGVDGKITKVNRIACVAGNSIQLTKVTIISHSTILKKGKVFRMHVVKTWGNVGINPLIRNLDTRWRWAVSFTARPLCPRGKCRLENISGSFQSGRFWQDKNPLLMPGIELQFVGCPPHSLFTIPTEQSRFPHKQNFQHIAFLRFYTREYYRERSRVCSRRTFERCMKFHIYAHRQITHGRSDFTPDLDACACLVPGTVDTTTNWAVTTNWPNTIPIHPPGRSWMVCVCVWCVRARRGESRGRSGPQDPRCDMNILTLTEPMSS